MKKKQTKVLLFLGLAGFAFWYWKKQQDQKALIASQQASQAAAQAVSTVVPSV